MKKKIRLTKIFSFMMVIIAVVALAGCNSKTNEKSDKGTSNFSNITIDTKFGEVKIDKKPKRIVALGWGDAETALALGVEPVGASDWLAFGGEGVGPWLKGAYKTAPTILGTMELDYEKIASLEPDLILDVRSSGDQKRYKRLSEIATTVGVPEGGDGYLTTYQQQVQIIAKALNKEEKGEKLLKDIDVAFENARKAYPQFAGKNVAVGAYTSEGWGAYVTGDARADFMTNLGFTNKKEIEKQAKGAFYIPVADENLELLDADLTVVIPIWVDKKEITGNTLYQKLPSVADGRAVIIDGEYANAFSTGTAPAMIWAIKQLPPLFDKALGSGE
ncbi:iron-siderophore ABC transporter substrate-binding protein [Viridibacillus arvi]|uniref:iron-siderophore ABC transporter substrate-binding protein n=1 Tax=Viridibacillus arvi TaxID=263475 RepID=UPI003D02EF99